MSDDVLGDKASMQARSSRDSRDVDGWVDAHGDALFAYASRRVWDRQAVEDLVQETFLAALTAKEGFRGESAVRTWLISILKHKIIDHLRKCVREQAGGEIETHDPLEEQAFTPKGFWKAIVRNWEPDAGALMESREFSAILDSCLEKLPKKMGQAFVLRMMDDTASEDVCKNLGITPTNLWVMLHRARARLRQCLEANWFGR